MKKFIAGMFAAACLFSVGFTTISTSVAYADDEIYIDDPTAESGDIYVDLDTGDYYVVE